MELFVIWFITLVATNEEIKSTQTDLLIAQHRTSVLEEQYESLANKHNILAGQHSAFYAGQQLVEQRQDQMLDAITKTVDDVLEHEHPHNHN